MSPAAHATMMPACICGHLIASGEQCGRFAALLLRVNDRWPDTFIAPAPLGSINLNTALSSGRLQTGIPGPDVKKAFILAAKIRSFKEARPASSVRGRNTSKVWV